MNEETLERLRAELETAVERGKGIDYATDGEGNEYAIDTFDSNCAVNAVIKVLQQWGLIPNKQA